MLKCCNNSKKRFLVTFPVDSLFWGTPKTLLAPKWGEASRSGMHDRHLQLHRQQGALETHTHKPSNAHSIIYCTCIYFKYLLILLILYFNNILNDGDWHEILELFGASKKKDLRRTWSLSCQQWLMRLPPSTRLTAAWRSWLAASSCRMSRLQPWRWPCQCHGVDMSWCFSFSLWFLRFLFVFWPYWWPP